MNRSEPVQHGANAAYMHGSKENGAGFKMAVPVLKAALCPVLLVQKMS